ncbi:hypothetical protein [Chryseobacterium arthrosphaerae]|uniref:hypothetical protein n=1 Tax=Chryseobacterium arthrosphaerae TaxID=651561 RepID=UPI00241C95E4|nr:hypothetical protein [Chryseobacterium arthrosphaerae]
MPSIYFKVEKTSKTGVEMQSLIDKGKEISNAIHEYMKEIGSSDMYLTRDRCVFQTGIAGVEFLEEQDMKVWKKFPGFPNYYRPRLSSLEGKKIDKKISSFEIIERDDINKVIGFDSIHRNCGFGSCNGYFGFIIDSDWNHQMPYDSIEVTYTEYKNLFEKNDTGTNQN